MENNDSNLKAEHPLIELGIEILRPCEFKCSFCFYENYDDPKRLVLEKEKIISLINEAKEFGVRTIRIFGGEPLLHKDLLETIKYTKSLGLELVLNTNGIFRTKEQRINILNSVDTIVISMHGFNKESQKVLTGRDDLFKKLLINLNHVTKDYSNKLIVTSLITSYLIDNIEKYIKILSTLGVKNWILNRPLFDKKYDWLKFSEEDVLSLFKKIKQYRQTSGINIRVIDYPHCFFDDDLKEIIAHNDYTNGVNRLFYDIDGYYKPVPSMNINLGNDLKEAWNKNPFNKVKTRNFVPETCRTCEEFNVCYGGSRAEAERYTGNYFERDPFMKKGLDNKIIQKNKITILPVLQ